MKQGKTKAAKPLTTNKHLIRWVEKMAELTQPAAIHWVDGSQKEYDRLCDEMVASETLIRLNQKTVAGMLLCALRPARCGARGGSYIHLLLFKRQCRADKQLDRSVSRCARS